MFKDQPIIIREILQILNHAETKFLEFGSALLKLQQEEPQRSPLIEGRPELGRRRPTTSSKSAGRASGSVAAVTALENASAALAPNWLAGGACSLGRRACAGRERSGGVEAVMWPSTSAQRF